jgi:hypothetical protein
MHLTNCSVLLRGATAVSLLPAKNGLSKPAKNVLSKQLCPALTPQLCPATLMNLGS